MIRDNTAWTNVVLPRICIGVRYSALSAALAAPLRFCSCLRSVEDVVVVVELATAADEDASSVAVDEDEDEDARGVAGDRTMRLRKKPLAPLVVMHSKILGASCLASLGSFQE